MTERGLQIARKRTHDPEASSLVAGSFEAQLNSVKKKAATPEGVGGESFGIWIHSQRTPNCLCPLHLSRDFQSAALLGEFALHLSDTSSPSLTDAPAPACELEFDACGLSANPRRRE